jgi:hypothetical protein
MMAKAPIPLQVKTRLFPELSPHQAAELCELFIQDMVQEMSELPQSVVSFALAFAPREAEAHFTAMLPANVAMFPQPGGGLGERMAGIFENMFEQGYGQVLIVGSDLPDLPRRVIESAMQALDQPGADLALGPTSDGGYYLIGLKRPVPQLFQDLPWSTSAVLERTLQKAKALGLSVALVEGWEDVDTYEDLVRFMARHAEREIEERGPGWRTLEWGRQFLAGDAP